MQQIKATNKAGKAVRRRALKGC